MHVLGLRIVVPAVLQRSVRGHHVPALTVTSGGRDVGTDVACSDKSSRRENGTESGGVDTQIPVTERETHQVAKFGGPPKFTFGSSGCLLVAVALGLGLDAPGVGVGLSGFVSFL